MTNFQQGNNLQKILPTMLVIVNWTLYIESS